LLSIYVNRESKMKTYGIKDPMTEIEIIRSKAANMSDIDLHHSISNLFLGFRDFHTNYFLPGPYQCYCALYPLEFDFVHDEALNSLVVVVKSTNRIPEMSQIIPKEQLDTISIGDVLVLIDGKSFAQFHLATQNVTGGIVYL
jgi:hypothetical protein